MNRGTMRVNSLPKTVTWRRRDCDLNPGPSAPESSTLITRLPSHPQETECDFRNRPFWRRSLHPISCRCTGDHDHTELVLGHRDDVAMKMCDAGLGAEVLSTFSECCLRLLPFSTVVWTWEFQRTVSRGMTDHVVDLWRGTDRQWAVLQRDWTDSCCRRAVLPHRRSRDAPAADHVTVRRSRDRRRQNHRHRIDKYLDTLLANQPISDGEATDRCKS